MKKTFINHKEVREELVENLTQGFLQAKHCKNSMAGSEDGSIIYSDWEVGDFTIQVRQFFTRKRKPVAFEIIDDENAGTSFFLSVFSPLAVTWEGLPLRVLKEGSYGLLHLQSERMKASLKKGICTLYKIILPEYYLEYLMGEHCRLAHFYTQVKARQPAVLFTPENIRACWTIYFALKEFINTSLDMKGGSYVLSHFLTECIDPLIPDLVKGGKRPLVIPNNMYMIEKAASIIRSEPNNHFRIRNLPARAGMSKTNLNVGFQKLYGVTPFEYLTELRMKKAVSLILNTNDTLNSIASETGYQHGYTLVKMLRHYLNVNASDLRRKEFVQSGN